MQAAFIRFTKKISGFFAAVVTAILGDTIRGGCGYMLIADTMDFDDVMLIRKSNFFDEVWYYKHNPQVKTMGMDCARHYLEYGAHEGLNPGPNFDTNFYREANPDVTELNMNPLIHYIKFGKNNGNAVKPSDNQEQRNIDLIVDSGFFDKEWYCNTYPDIKEADLDPARHYLEHGAGEGRDPGPQFSTLFYIKTYPDVASGGLNPLLHYLRHGIMEGRKARPNVFDPDFYLALYPEVAAAGLAPSEHYEKAGRAEHRHPFFDATWYRQEYPELHGTDGELRHHYLTIGKDCGFHPRFDEGWYLLEYVEARDSQLSPLDHYREIGVLKGLHPAFDRYFYLHEYEDIRQAGIDPFRHYREHGKNEGRLPAFNRRWYARVYPDVGAGDWDAFEHYDKVGRVQKRRLSPSLMDKRIIPGTLLDPIVPNATELPPHRRINLDFDSQFLPKVSVVVPNYNHERFLRERLDSIYEQTYPNFEVILLDDCSSDASCVILNEYAQRYPDKTIRAFNTQNSGKVFKQWKKGVELATGELIWIAESDDYCMRNLLSSLVPLFHNQAVMLAFARTEFVRGNPPQRVWTSEEYLGEIGVDLGVMPAIWTAHELVRGGWVARNFLPNVSATLFRRPADLTLFDDPEWLNFQMCGDWVFYLKLARGGLVGYNPMATNFYRQHNVNTSTGTHDKDLYYTEHSKVIQYIKSLYKLSKKHVDAHMAVQYCHWCMKRGDTSREIYNSFMEINWKTIRMTRQYNIGIFIYAFVSGGGETFPIFLANLLHNTGYCVTVFNFNKEPTNPGIRYMLHTSIPVVDIFESDMDGLPEVLTEFGIEIVHTHHSWVDIVMAMHLHELKNIRHVVTMHGMYELMQIGELQHYEQELRDVDSFVYIANKNLYNFSSKFLRGHNFTKIMNSVPQKARSQVSRDALELSSTDFVVTLASRAVPAKGWEEAIAAVELVNASSSRSMILLLVGEGPEYERLHNRYASKHIRFLGFRDDVESVFALSNLGLIASSFKGESCPLVLIECLNAGVPMVATNVGEVVTMLDSCDGLAGAVCDLEDWTLDVDKLAAILKNICEDHQYYTSLKQRVPLARKKFDQHLMLNSYCDVYDSIMQTPHIVSEERLRLSIIMTTYNMARELPRTLMTLTEIYQRGLSAYEYEIVIVDNGSTCAYDLSQLYAICPNLLFSSFLEPTQSPVKAINHAARLARGDILCVWIDGARMSSPGLLQLGLTACDKDPRMVVGSLSFHLGAEPQNDSVLHGYDQHAEDALLQTIDWASNGYDLFKISSFDPSSRFGVFSCPAESNAVFLHKDLWEEMGGMDPAFVEKGGGLVNLDFWRRVCEDNRNIITLLLGEGTFHQFHGGAATNAKENPWGVFHNEYKEIRGIDYCLPSVRPFLYGSVSKDFIAFEERRLQQAVSSRD